MWDMTSYARTASTGLVKRLANQILASMGPQREDERPLNTFCPRADTQPWRAYTPSSLSNLPMSSLRT